MLNKKQISEIYGWLMPESAQLLYDCAMKAPLPRILELGTYVGKSACALGQALRDRGDFGTLVCCDLFPDKVWFVKEGLDEPIRINNTLGMTWDNINRCGLQDYIITLKGDHTNLQKQITGRFGMVYIDGDHSYESATRDLESSWDITVNGGFIVLDDYEIVKFPGVVKAVDDFSIKYGIPFYARHMRTVVLQKPI